MFSVSQTLWLAQSLSVCAWKATRSADAALHSPASFGSRWPNAAVLSSPRGSLPLQPVSPWALPSFLPFASRFRERGLENIANVPKLKPWEVVALWPGVLRLSINCSNNQNHGSCQEEGDQNCSAGKQHKKVSEILYRVATWLFGKGDALFPKNCFMLNPWKLIGNQLGKNHGKSCEVLWVTYFQAKLSITQPLPALGYVRVSSELKFTPMHFCSLVKIRHILRN